MVKCIKCGAVYGKQPERCFYCDAVSEFEEVDNKEYQEEQLKKYEKKEEVKEEKTEEAPKKKGRKKKTKEE